jgi:1-aminocyclopropane-1-carboxylate deaminase
VGTGTMMAGLINASIQKQLIIGFSVLKNNREASKKIKTLVANNRQNFEIIHDYHFGGYAKKNEELLHFMNYFHEHHKIPTDFVYTGKLFYGVCDLIKKNYFAPGSKVLIIHSGGIQGNDSLKEGTLIF